MHKLQCMHSQLTFAGLNFIIFALASRTLHWTMLAVLLLSLFLTNNCSAKSLLSYNRNKKKEEMIEKSTAL